MAIFTEQTDWQRGITLVPEWVNLGLFGGRGAGRTTGALFCTTKHLEVHGPRAHVLFLRQTLRSLREVEDSFQSVLSIAFPGVRVNRQDHEFRLPGGGTVEFAPINDVEDMTKLQGRSFSLIVCDEYGNFTPQQMRFVDELRANLRAGDVPTRMIFLANPGGRGHSLIKARFIDRMVPLVPQRLEDGTEWAWHPANYDVNPHNPTNYISALEASAHKDKELLRAWTQGDWNIARGAMFADCMDEAIHRFLNRDLPWVVDPSRFPPNSSQFHSFLASDWGQSRPAVAFACRKLLQPLGMFPRGSLILEDEVSSADPDDYAVGMNWSIGKFADAMQEMCDRNHTYKVGCIDDARGLSPDDTLINGMSQYNFSFERPAKNRRSGWAVMREMLTNAKEANGKPGLWISQNCRGFWATVPTMPRDPVNAEDVDTRSVDHWGDAGRYACTYEIGVARVNNPTATVRRFGLGGPGAPRTA